MKVKDQNKSKVKSLDDFELFYPNLLEGIPFDFGFTFHGSIRVIQKANQAELNQIFKENFAGIEYVKEGPDKDFVLFGSKPEHKAYILEGLENKEKDEAIGQRNILIFGGVIALFFCVLYFAFDQDLRGFQGMIAYAVIMLVGAVYSIIRIRIDAKKDPKDKIATFHKKRSQALLGAFNNTSVFILPAILIVTFIFQFNDNFHISDWALQGNQGSQIWFKSIFTASFIETNGFLLCISVLALSFLSASFLQIAKLPYLLLVFIISASLGNLTYNIFGNEVLSGAGTGIAGLLAAYLIGLNRFFGQRLLLHFGYLVFLTAVWFVGIYYFDEWGEYLQYGFSFWCGAILGLIMPIIPQDKIESLSSNDNE